MKIQFRSGLAAKLVVAFLTVSIVPLAILAFITFQSTNTLGDKVGKGLQTAAQTIVDKVERNLFERYGDVQAFGANAAVRNRAGWYKPDPKENPVVEAANRYAALYGFYLLSILVDLDGRVIAVVFIPAPVLAKVPVGTKLAIACDGCPANAGAEIVSIGDETEFTPPIIYSDAERSRLVYRAEARFSGFAPPPGTPLRAEIARDAK